MQSSATPGLCSGELLPLSLPCSPQGAFTGPSYWVKEWLCPPMQCPGLGQVHSSLLPKPRADPSRNLPRGQRRIRGSLSHCHPGGAQRKAQLRGCWGHQRRLSWDPFLCREREQQPELCSAPVRGFFTSAQETTRFPSLLNMQPGCCTTWI